MIAINDQFHRSNVALLWILIDGASCLMRLQMIQMPPNMPPQRSTRVRQMIPHLSRHQIKLGLSAVNFGVDVKVLCDQIRKIPIYLHFCKDLSAMILKIRGQGVQRK